MSQLEPSDTLKAIWRFVRGDTASPEFERWAYESARLEAVLGAERHLDLISVNFNDPEQVDRMRADLRNFAFAASNLECLCITLPNLAVVDMGDHEEVFASLRELRRRGPAHWWLSLYACRACQQGWLVAQEERHNDIFCMRRLHENQVPLVVDQDVWPDEFDRFESLLRIGAEFGRSVRFIDPLG